MNKNQKIGVAVVAIIVILLIAYGLVVNRDANDINIIDLEDGEVINEDGEVVSQSSVNSISPVANQEAGDSVYVPEVTLAEDGWVSVYELMNDKPLNVLGAKYLPTGTHKDVVVVLQVPSATDTSYAVVIHSDDGKEAENELFGKYEFNPREDDALTDSQGNWIMQTFSTVISGSRGL